MSRPASASASPTPNTILHLGTGSFHRAHQAWYLHRLIANGDATDWSLAVADIRGGGKELLATLDSQNCVYTLETVNPRGKRHYEEIRSVRRAVPWTADLAAVIDVGAADSTRIISFTVTEAGYFLDGHYRLDDSQGDLQTDLEGGHRSIYGTIAAILRERARRGSGKVTLQSCDNLRSNGVRFRGGMIEFLERTGDSALRDWFIANTSCPNAMVDRITPRPDEEVVARVQAAGFKDAVPVLAETFTQWVIEDSFVAGRPPWEKAGAQLVDSVETYEEAKIRILNATHSVFAWAGTLAGLSYIHEGVEDDTIRQMAFDYITNDVIPALSPSKIDLADYRDTVLDRFSNSFIRDTNQRVAADGYSKTLGFIMPTVRDRLAAGASIDATVRLPALFFVFLEQWHKGKLPFEYEDGIMVPEAAHAFFTAEDSELAFSQEALLWGKTTGRPEVLEALRRQIGEVRTWLAERNAGVRT